MRNAARVFVVTLTFFACSAVVAGAQECPSLRTQFLAARDAGDLDRLTALIREGDLSTNHCSPQEQACMGRIAADRYANEATKQLMSGGDGAVERADDILRKAPAGTWSVLAMRAKILNFKASRANDRKLFSAASLLFERALTDIRESREGGGCPQFGGMDGPSQDTFKDIQAGAGTARVLADKLVITRNRKGECGGAFDAMSTRGIRPEPQPVPILFELDQASLTPEGKEQTHQLGECLINHNFIAITLSGHTDTSGYGPPQQIDAYNMDLSARRLDSVQKFLREMGYTGRITLSPRGMRQPFHFADEVELPQAFKDKAERRVELRDAVTGEPAK